MELDVASGWADPSPAVAALAVGPQDDVLCLAGTFEEALALLLAGARSVTWVEPALPRRAVAGLYLCAARALPIQSVRALFGHDAAGRRVWFYHYVRAALDPELRAWWDAREHLVRQGIEASGRLERHLDRARRLLGSALPSALPSALARRWDDLPGAERAALAQGPWCGAAGLAGLRLALSRPLLDRLALCSGGRPGLGLDGAAIFAGLDRRLRLDDQSPGPYARRLLLGGWGEGAGAPLHLRAEGVRGLPPVVDGLRVLPAEPFAALRALSAGVFSALHLGDLLLRADEGKVEVGSLWAALLRVARPDARLVWRDRARPSGPPRLLPPAISSDPAEDRALAELDQGFFCAPLRVGRQGG